MDRTQDDGTRGDRMGHDGTQNGTRGDTTPQRMIGEETAGHNHMGHDGTRRDTTRHDGTQSGTQWEAREHNGTQRGTLGYGMGRKGTHAMGHEGTQWDTLPKDWRGQLGIQHFGTRRDTMGHPTLYLRNRREHVGIQHVGTRRDTLGHDKIWDTKSGAQNLGRKIWARSLKQKNWDKKFGTRNGREGDITPYLRIGARGHVGVQHVGTRWDNIILGTGGNKLGCSTLGHDGT